MNSVPLPSKCWGFLTTISCLCTGHFCFLEWRGGFGGVVLVSNNALLCDFRPLTSLWALIYPPVKWRLAEVEAFPALTQPWDLGK